MTDNEIQGVFRWDRDMFRLHIGDAGLPVYLYDRELDDASADPTLEYKIGEAGYRITTPPARTGSGWEIGLQIK